VNEGSRKRVKVAQGDSLDGDAARFSVAELVVRVSGSAMWGVWMRWSPFDMEALDERVWDKPCVYVCLPVQSLDRPEAVKKDICLINEEGPPLDDKDWDAVFKGFKAF
jgi:hypothetical protein